MPRQEKKARLWLRQTKGRDPVYVILDRGRQISTGFGIGAEDRANVRLAEYITAKNIDTSGPKETRITPIDEALYAYLEERAPKTKSEERIMYSILALSKFWSGRLVSEITYETVDEYIAKRKGDGVKIGTIRRELADLRSALNYHVKRGRMASAPFIPLPLRPPGKDRWFEPYEVATLLRVARRKSGTRHLARFILTGIYTGSRKEAILSLTFKPQDIGGWVDTSKGFMYRRGAEEVDSNKRRPPISMPARLLLFMRYWERNSNGNLIEFQGGPVSSIRSAWRSVMKTCKEEYGMEHATPHTLRHTAITWAMQNGGNMDEASKYFGIGRSELERTYWHHHPDFASSIKQSLTNRRKSVRQ